MKFTGNFIEILRQLGCGSTGLYFSLLSGAIVLHHRQWTICIIDEILI